MLTSLFSLGVPHSHTTMKKLLLLLVTAAFTIHQGNAQLPPVQQKAIIVKRVIEMNHLSPKPVNDSFSITMFKAIINTADRRRLLFTDAEFKSLQVYETKLDDELNGGKWIFFDQFLGLYKKALVRADSLVSKLTQKPFDFTASEKVSFGKRDMFNFAADLPALSSRWLRYMKYTALSEMYEEVSDDETGNTSFKSVIARSEPMTREWIRKTEIKTLKRVTEHASGIDGYVKELYLNALASVFDPHTNYFSPQANENFKEQLSGEELSFGLDLDENEDGEIVVDQLAPGGSAWKTGELNKGDVVLSIVEEGKQAVDMTGATLDEAEEELDKPSAKKIILKVQKTDGTTQQVMLRKEKIEDEESIVKSFILEGEKKIGYILLPGFYTEWENESGSSCANDVAKEIVKLKKENIDGLILDVRYNGGGSMGEALDMLGIFIDEGPLLGLKLNEPKVTFLKDPNRGTIYAGPMALMINGQSASASEILAASLQDYNRAVIVGSNSFGKATMQQMHPLDTFAKKDAKPPSGNKEMVKITGGKLYRLTGETAQRNGVKPDVILPDAFDGLEYREKFYPNVLGAEPVAKNNYYKPLPTLPVADLAAKSAQRVKDNSGFATINTIVKAMITRTENTASVSLKWDEFETWAKQNDKEADLLKGEQKTEKPVYSVTNHSLDKALLINNEYARELNSEWLADIGTDIYIHETYRVLCDLIKLR